MFSCCCAELDPALQVRIAEEVFEADVPWTTADPCDVLAHVAHMLECGRPAWHADGACRSRRDVNWFPLRGEDVRPAQAVCAGCPVQVECRAFAMADRSLCGVWGGLSVAGRKALRRRDAA